MGDPPPRAKYAKKFKFPAKNIYHQLKLAHIDIIITLFSTDFLNESLNGMLSETSIAKYDKKLKFSRQNSLF